MRILKMKIVFKRKKLLFFFVLVIAGSGSNTSKVFVTLTTQRKIIKYFVKQTIEEMKI